MRNGTPPKLGVLISGRGSNLQSISDAIRDGRLIASIALVLSNNAEAQGLERARAVAIPTAVVPHRSYASREAYDRALVDVLKSHDVDLVCLAGFMRLLGPAFVDAFPNRILNIHPSLLPAFPGVDAQRQALEHGVKISGATVHLVTTALDAGPIVLQAAVPVMPTDTTETLAARILQEEHRIYPEAIRLILSREWRLDGRRFLPQ
jgi:phosphoribosylglycinamide formyltransferase-1